MSEPILISSRKGLFVLQREQTGWQITRTAFLGENVTLTFADPRDGGWYAALNLGHFGVKLKYSPDQGATWEDRAVPTFPEGEVVTTGDGKEPSRAVLKLIWALEAGGESEPGRLWAGTIPGGLFRSDDGARSWELIRGLWDRPERAMWFGGGYDFPGIHSICRDPRDPATLRLGISCGGVWQTQDHGANWQVIANGMYADYMPPEQRSNPVIQDVHMLVQCPSSPDCLWVQHHNGIFRTTDAGQNWESSENVLPSKFGFGVAVHPKDPKTAWFVPAVKDECRVPKDGQFVVTRTRDGGQSFEVLRKGLPQHHAYDIVFRHALAIDRTGNRLAVGSTTGGVWITENQGDTWTELPARLPPIHAVCFAK